MIIQEIIHSLICSAMTIFSVCSLRDFVQSKDSAENRLLRMRWLVASSIELWEHIIIKVIIVFIC